MNSKDRVRENIIRRIAQLPDSKQVYLAARGGLSQGVVSEVLARKHYVGLDTIDRWATICGCEPYELLLDKPLPEHGPVYQVLTLPEARRAAQDTAGELVAVPIIPGHIAASVSGSQDIRERDIEECAVIVRKWCRSPRDYTCIRVAGDSMCPTLCPGFIVAIHHAERDPKGLNGHMVAVRLEDDGAAVKRLRLQLKHKLGLLTSDGDRLYGDFAPIPIPANELRDRIIGKIVWWWGKQ